MRQTTKLKNALELHVQRTVNSVRMLAGRIDNWAVQHRDLRAEFNDLRDELATNGVVRDLRKLQKDFKELQMHTASLIMEHDRQLQELKTNGVATAINKLHEEVFHDRKNAVEEGWGVSRFIAAMAGEEIETPQEPTLAGKVEAIIEHLGLDVTVKPQEVKEAKVTAKKVSTKKKGRR